MLSILICTLMTSTFSIATPWQDKAQSLINNMIVDVGASKDDFGLYIIKDGQSVSHNGDVQFVPASLSKIPTALAFANQASMGDHFKTWIYHTGKIKDGTLNGDLYLKGGGDPSLVSEVLWKMVTELRRSDINKINGQLYVDETYFDSDYYSDGRQQRRVDRAYDAPVSGLSSNWNSLTIHVRPGKGWGAAARVYVEPNLSLITVKNTATTSSRGKSSLKVERLLKDGKVTIRVSGKIPKTLDEKTFYKSVGDAALWTGYSFKQHLSQQGIEYSGDVTKKIVPKKALLLVEQDSWSMPRILSALSKFSNNFVAEMLTKQMGRTGESPASIDAGLDKIRNFLESKGWKKGDYEFVNPSGFTRVNKMKPRLLTELLSRSKENFAVASEFLSSLPISGTDGTLKKRMTQVMKGKVRAKTGYLTGVVGLAGYLQQQKADAEPIVFVFFYNGPYKYDWKVRAAFDTLLWRLYQNS